MKMSRSARSGIGMGLLLAWAGGLRGEMGYMRTVADEDLARPHVLCRTVPVPHDFVDGQWEGIIAASDGKTYFSVSSHGPRTNAQFYRYDPKTGQVEHLIDVAEWCGDGAFVGKHNVQGKIHSIIYEIGGKLYCSSCAAHRPPDIPPRSGHFLRYDLRTGACEDLGASPLEGEGLMTLHHEPVRGRLYALTGPRQTLCHYDLATGKIVALDSVADEGSAQSRMLFSDRFGCVYGGVGDGMIWRFNPENDGLSCLLTRVPCDPEAPQPAPGSWHWAWQHWHPIVRDPESDWWYGVRANDEYLFRIRAPDNPRSHRAAVEGLAPFGFRPSAEQPRFASLALAVLGRKLYYVSYQWGKQFAHLMSYDIPAGHVADHGILVDQDRRGLTECHSLVAAPGDRLHAVAMSWSIEGQDPAQPWGNRGNCYFHARFMIIDPAEDFHPGEAGAAPRPQAVAAESRP